MLQFSNSSDKPSYEIWNRAIGGFFYTSTSAELPVYLQLDSETLREIGPRIGIEPDQAEHSFVQAIRSRLRLQHGDLFDNFRHQVRRWQVLDIKANPTTPPPFLGLLGICVLAASRMTSDPTRGVSSANYYVHLNELLGLKQQGTPRSFERVSELWPQLDEWLEKTNKGKLGLPTSRTHSWFRHVGYPISQCLLRKIDRQKLPDFFQWARLDPKGEIGFEELIPLLRQWINRTTCTLSERGRMVFANADQELMKSAAEIVAAEFRVWDGSVEDVEGHRSIKMLLRLEVSSGGRRCICELYSPAPKDFPEGSYRAGTQNQNVNLSRLPHGEWFMPITGQQAMQALQYGLVLKKDKCALKFDTASVIILGEHDELGGWVSCSRVQFGEKHLVLCRTDYADGVTKYLEQYAKSGWEFVSTTQGLPSTWNIFRNVQIAAWPDNPTGELDCLCPRLHIGISLKHGLKVTRDAWFVDGAPTVVIVTPDRRPVAVYIDGHEIKSLSLGSGEISLADLNLTVGEHEVVVGKQSRIFQLSDTGYAPISGDTLGYVINRDEGRLSPVSLGATVTSMPEQSSAHTIIVGARMFGIHVEETLTLTHGYKRYIILGRRPGEILEYQPKPGYLQDEVEIAVSFEPQWLIRVGRKGKEIRAVVPGTMPQAPEATIADQSRVADWIQWARKRYHNLKSKPQHRELWEQYRQLATELSNTTR